MLEIFGACSNCKSNARNAYEEVSLNEKFLDDVILWFVIEL